MLKKYKDWDLRKDVSKYKAVESFDPIYWGDELEAHVVEFDEENKRVRIVTDLEEIYDYVNDPKVNDISFKIVPEYGAWMIETTPKEPYFTVNNLDPVIISLEDRHKVITKHLRKDEHVLLTSTF